MTGELQMQKQFNDLVFDGHRASVMAKVDAECLFNVSDIRQKLEMLEL